MDASKASTDVITIVRQVPCPMPSDRAVPGQRFHPFQGELFTKDADTPDIVFIDCTARKAIILKKLTSLLNG